MIDPRKPKVSASETFEIESSSDVLAAIPPGVFIDDLSAAARLILLLAFTLPEKPSKTVLMLLAGIKGETKWKKVCRELQVKGWLVRRNHGGGGRGIWRHERIFMRSPIPDPLLGELVLALVSEVASLKPA